MTVEATSIENSPLQRFEHIASRKTIKRGLLLALLFLLGLTFIELTRSRFLGQGLHPEYFRSGDIGNILSLFTFCIAAVPVVRAIRKPHRIGFWQLSAALVYATGLLWIIIGIQKFDATDFPPISSVALLGAIFGELAILLTARRFETNKLRESAKFSLRVIRNTIVLYLVYAVFGFIFNFVYPSYPTAQEISAFNADAGVVFGAAVWSGNELGNRPSPTLRARIDVGYELLANKTIPRLVVTGANAPGEQTEANVARQEIIKRGADPSAIITEEQSHSTFDQVRYIRDELIKKQGWSRFLVISDQYHLARILQICKLNNIRAIGMPSQIRQPFLDLLFYRVRESIALLAYWLLGK